MFYMNWIGFFCLTLGASLVLLAGFVKESKHSTDCAAFGIGIGVLGICIIVATQLAAALT